MTLDAIEARMASEFGDARMLLAIGRGAVGGGRLRSEAFRGEAVGRQLEEAVKECAARAVCISVDLGTRTVTANPLFGWRAEAFERSFLTGRRRPVADAQRHRARHRRDGFPVHS